MKPVCLLILLCLVAAAAGRRDLSQVSSSASATATSASTSGGSVSSRASASSGPAGAQTTSVESSTSTDARVDVYCLVDITERNTNYVGELAANAQELIQSIFQRFSRARFGLGTYSDDEAGGFSFTRLLSVTNDQANAISAVSGLSAINTSFPQESQFFALESVATDSNLGFRDNSDKIIVWIGNRRGADPVGNSTEATVTGALTAGGFSVIAIDTERLNAVGQASRIASATNGIFYKVNDAGLFETVELSQTANQGASAASASATGDSTVVTTTVDGDTTTVTGPVNLVRAVLDGVFALGD